MRPDWKGPRSGLPLGTGGESRNPGKPFYDEYLFLEARSAKGETAVQNRKKILENFLKKVYNFLKNEHSTIYAGRHT